MIHTGSIDRVIDNWKEQPRDTAHRLIDKYGQPDEVCSDMAVWHGKGPWKRIVLRNEEIEHRFPKPHMDCLECVIDYRVPSGKMCEIGRFDGSVLIDRTKGEMSARCDREEANVLALNLAHEIIIGQRNVDDARREYGKQMQAFMNGESAPYVEGFMFGPPRGNTNDPDEQTIRMNV
jgi:hypothetical protein